MASLFRGGTRVVVVASVLLSALALGCGTTPAASAGGQAGNDGAAAGAAGIGGAAGAGAAGADGGSADAGDAFTLAWQDDFDTLDLTVWQLQTFTYGGNLAQFSTQNASVADGILTIGLTPNPNSTTEPYNGVEMRSSKTLTYGKVSARMRFATGSGVVSGLVLFYTPYPNCNWNEIDIEHLGDSASTSQLNCQVYTGTPVPGCATSVSPTQNPLVVPLGVDAEADFHQYDIEWTPAGVKFFVDGALLRTWTTHIDLMNLPQTILLTIWASNAASWAGPITSTSAPTSADVDWIKVYSWNG
ncbi:MAG TPA: glycoside hydrolase family 16 protein [Polyangia bacterium]|nr:glycoside hydrolase family 16 protein [Polyangia bacterium]